MPIRNVYASGLVWLWGQLRTAFDQESTTATIAARASAGDGYTGKSPTWEVVAEDVPCLVRPLRAEDVVLQERSSSKAWAQIYFLVDPGVTAAHRITVGGVVYIPTPTLALDKSSGLYRVDCYEIGG